MTSSKYYNHNQKVYLINISEHRDKELYESLSGSIVGRNRNSLTVRTPYPTEYTTPTNASRHVTFKLVTEAMGNGIQTIAELVKVEAGTILHLKLRGNLEMYQRRRAPRANTIIKLFQGQCATSLDIYRKEFRRISDYLKTRGVPSGLEMREETVNLGVGGIRVVQEAKGNQALLLLFIIELNDNALPVCALGDLVWDRFENGVRVCGYRFIHISKTDQERIRGVIQSLWKQRNIAVPQPSVTWELLDRMMHEETPASR